MCTYFNAKGPAYGFAVTTLALCDVVYAAANANFTTPFMKLGMLSCCTIIYANVNQIIQALLQRDVHQFYSQESWVHQKQMKCW